MADLPTRGAGEVVVDVGAHIGSFARKWWDKNRKASIFCFEACRENMPFLRINVGSFAQCFCGAVTYETGNVRLLNSIFQENREQGTATGGSRIVRVLDTGELETTETFGHTAYADDRPLKLLRLEDVVGRIDRLSGRTIDTIDVLKLDCEGSEFSILENSPSIDSAVRLIVGEFHDTSRWERLRRERFENWPYRLVSTHPTKSLGIFHLLNPRFYPNVKTAKTAE